MSEGITHLKTSDFDKKTEKGTWIVDFWASWCGPCKMMAPVFKSTAEKRKNIHFGKVDIEEEQEIAQNYNIVSIPTFLAIKDGEVVNQTSGFMDEDDFNEFIDESFK